MSDCLVQFYVLLNFEFVKIRCLYKKYYRNFCVSVCCCRNPVLVWMLFCNFKSNKQQVTK